MLLKSAQQKETIDIMNVTNFIIIKQIPWNLYNVYCTSDIYW